MPAVDDALPGLALLLAIFGGVVLLGLRDRRRGVTGGAGEPVAGPAPLATVYAPAPKECLEAITAHMTHAGYAVSYLGESAATFTRPKRANTDVGCLLLLLGLVPGLLYFGLFRGTQTVSVTAFGGEAGATLNVSGDDLAGVRELRGWMEANLPRA
jgi:hypothetical protein